MCYSYARGGGKDRSLVTPEGEREGKVEFGCVTVIFTGTPLYYSIYNSFVLSFFKVNRFENNRLVARMNDEYFNNADVTAFFRGYLGSYHAHV